MTALDERTDEDAQTEFVPRLRLAVITRTPQWRVEDITDIAPRGNMATAMGEVFIDPQAFGGTSQDPLQRLGTAIGAPLIEIFAMVRVFKQGELLLLDGNDRDQFGRKPSKWDVDYEEFDDIEAAVNRVREVTVE